MPSPLVVTALACAGLGTLFLVAASAAFRRRRWLGAAGCCLLGALFWALAGLAGTLTVAMRGYRALTLEVVAAKIKTEPIGPRQFRATIVLADSSLHMYNLAGDAVYVDAHILKWHPLVNILGLHTAYELDRVAGRYDDVAREQAGPHTVYELGRRKPLDMFELARRFTLLRPLVDAEYGSATYIGTRLPAEFEVRVSTTGLLLRRVGPLTPSAGSRSP